MATHALTPDANGQDATAPPRTSGAWTTFDPDAGQAIEAGVAAPVKRRRGRPPRALGTTVLQNSPITVDEIAFMRAWLQGVHLSHAARHYLPGEVHNDGRAADRYAHQLLERLRAVSEQLPEREKALAYVAGIAELQAAATAPPAPPDPSAAASLPGPHATHEPGQHVQAPPADAPPTRSAALPTLEDFAARFPEDMYSEADLLELYEEEFGGQQAATAPGPAVAPPSHAEAAPPSPGVPSAPALPRLAYDVTRLEMLEWLAPLVSVKPEKDAEIGLWLGKAAGDVLRKQLGLKTLHDLATWINITGPRWHDQVPGMGRLRARRLVAWLVEHEDAVGVRLRERVSAHARSAGTAGRSSPVASGPPWPQLPVDAARDAAPALRYALVPRDQLLWPQFLNGAGGLLRKPGLNTYGASNDEQALQAWLSVEVDNLAPASQAVAQRAIEKFVLWAMLERRQALSSMMALDLVQFREFLYAPPAHWCTGERVMRFAEEWRPMRGPLSAVAVTQALGVVKRMYAAWYAAGYLEMNPAHGLSARRERRPDDPVKQPAVKALSMDVKRSFVEQDLDAMRKTLEAMPDGPARRRLRAILSLFIDSGLRRSEVDELTMGTAVPIRLNNELTDVMQITVIGKGDKERQIPVMRRTLQALEDHYQDRMDLIKAGKLDGAYARIPREKTPALSVLQRSRPAGKAGPGTSPADAPRKENKDGRLDGDSIYSILKGFFLKVSQRDDLVHGQADFQRASTHWLRHSFAHRVLATGQASLPTLQALLGHASLNTTGIYLDADMADRVRAIAALKQVF